ncbi:MAG: TPM domain-containing protein, partial [Bacteroidales bacterium]|nr:TPM domain-containing protein [Bacteroidales bacterium]
MKTTVKIKWGLLALVVLLGVCLPGCRGIADKVQAAIPARPSPQRLVNDLAEVFSAAQVRHLEAMLVAFDDSTSNQIAVVTVKDLEGRTPADYAYRIGQEWGVGGQDFNNGIVVLVKPKSERSSGQVSIQVGYGLEGAIPDVYAKRIIDNQMIPHFRDNDYYGGVLAACEQLMAFASGEISVARDRDEEIDAEDLVALLILLGLL